MNKKVIMSLTLSAILILGTTLTGCNKKVADKPIISNEPEKRGKITVSVYDRGTIPASEGTSIENRWTKWINEKGPVDVTYVAIPRSDPGQKYGVLFAAGQAPDLCLEYDPSIKQPYYQQGLMMPIKDLIDKYSTTYKETMLKNPALAKVGVMDDGKLYQFGRLSENAPLFGLYIRKDWLDKLNLKVPTTTDELLQVAKAFTGKDLNGTGKPDSLGFTEVVNAETVKAIFGFNTKVGGFPYTVKDGALVYDTKPTLEYAKFKKALYDQGSVDKEYQLDKTGAKARQLMTSGKVGIIVAQEGQMLPDLSQLKATVPQAEIIPIALPESPVGKFNTMVVNSIQAVGFINSQCKDPQSVIKYIDFMAKVDTKKTLKYGIEGTHYKMVNGFAQIIDADKYKTEVGYAGDLLMICTNEVYNDPKGPYNLSDPIQKSQSDLYVADRKLYFNTKLPYAGLTYSEHIPALPKNLATNYNSMLLQLTDLWNKSIISGTAYTPEQAEKEMADIWKKSGGADVDKFYSDWYKNSKNTTVMAKDLYDALDKEIKDRNLPY
jgi:putative aldouronate transport system substrate-binding protein